MTLETIVDGIKGFDDLLFYQLIAIEFVVGAVIGVVLNQYAKHKAARDSQCQVIDAVNYSSPHKPSPKRRGELIIEGAMNLHPFDIVFPFFRFVILKPSEHGVPIETIYGVFGSRTQAIHENGEYKRHEDGSLNAPMYYCTVLIPAVLGFLLLNISFENRLALPLFFSGVTWLYVTFIILGIVRYKAYGSQF